MRILYGIQGTGNGHLTRARALLPALLAENLDVDCVLTGRPRKDYFNMELFGDFACYSGLSLVTERGQLKSWKTFSDNNLLQFWRDLTALNVHNYDLVISDFEPVTAWAAKLRKIPSLGISHQSAFAYAVPSVRGFGPSRFLMQRFAPVDTAVGLHWHHFSQPIMPPLIERLSPGRVVHNKIVVYMGFEAIDDIRSFLAPFTDFRFCVYAKVGGESNYGHVTVKPFSYGEFHRDLSDCFGVISNAGFELASECLVLGKKLLVKPLLGQFEQLSNALALQALNRATIIQELDQKILGKWLQQPGHARIAYPEVAAALALWIRDGRRQELRDLADSLWSQCNFPFEIDTKFGRSLLPGMIS